MVTLASGPTKPDGAVAALARREVLPAEQPLVGGEALVVLRESNFDEPHPKTFAQQMGHLLIGSHWKSETDVHILTVHYRTGSFARTSGNGTMM